MQRAQVDSPVPECDLVAKGVINGEARGWLLARTAGFRSDKIAETPIDKAGLVGLINAADEYLTFTCTPWGSGTRIGIDRDLDGVLDGDN